MQLGIKAEQCIYLPWMGSPGWEGAILDPTSEVISFRTLECDGPRVLGRELRLARDVMIAIGDVDDLKTFVETSKAFEYGSYGHIAGNRFMKQLGYEARHSLRSLDCEFSAVASFGGDELLFIVSGGGDSRDVGWIDCFRSRIRSRLPCGISFAAVSLTACPLSQDSERSVFEAAVLAADRQLMEVKRLRKQAHGRKTPIPNLMATVSRRGHVRWANV